MLGSSRRIASFLAGAMVWLGASSATAQFVFQVEGAQVNKRDTYQVPTWDQVNLQFTYASPIIVALPNSNGGDPADFRIRNITSTGFELTLSEPPSEDGPHIAMDIAYVAVEAGQWSLPDGRFMAAGTVATNQVVFKNGGGFRTVSLPPGFTNPIVLAQIQGLANEQNNLPSQTSNPFLSVAVRNVTAGSFELALEGAECLSTASLPLPEIVGWIAIDGNVSGSFVDTDGKSIVYETIQTGNVVPGWQDGSVMIPFSQSYNPTPLFVAKLQTRNESDGGWPRFLNLGSTSVSLRVDEDRCLDGERFHNGETGGLFVFSESFRIQDPDPDGDGLASSVDNCPFTFNPNQNDADFDGRGDVCDNCPAVANPSQSDVNQNAIGDACDCGDGFVAANEQCDDQNPNPGDGCTSCNVDFGYACNGQPSVCAPICGDGFIVGGEGCDDLNGGGGDGCSAICQIEPGWICQGEPSVCSTVCGDGIVVGAETCDDGNTGDGDGCSSLCREERGFTCVGQPSVCSPTCGDGLILPGEACDDGDVADGDGCSGDCEVERGFTCVGEPSTCFAECGDGIIASVEACDDANTIGGDGCSPFCSIEFGFSCIGEPSVCTPGCGDGFLAGSEECDDGNLVDGDGCSSVCTIEEPTGEGGAGGAGGGALTPTGGGGMGIGGGGPLSGSGTLGDLDSVFLTGRGCTCEVPTRGSREGALASLALLGLWLARRRRR
ncbi:MAG: DUF4215 domain-containing protein [Myxococcota bacterium]